MRRLTDHLTYANVTATLALFIALGGVSWAAATLPRNSVGNAQIKNGAVTPKKLSKSVQATLAKIAATTGAASVGATGPAGAQGPKGDTGATGPKGDTGVAGPKGDTGLAGPKGDKGDAGTNATIAGVAAGGDLSGSYPNPTLAANSVDDANVGSNALGGDDIDEGSLRFPGSAFSGSNPGLTRTLATTEFGTLTGTCFESPAGQFGIVFEWTNTSAFSQQVVADTSSAGGAQSTTASVITAGNAVAYTMAASATPNAGRSLRLSTFNGPLVVLANGITRQGGASNCSMWGLAIQS